MRPSCRLRSSTVTVFIGQLAEERSVAVASRIGTSGSGRTVETRGGGRHDHPRKASTSCVELARFGGGVSASPLRRSRFPLSPSRAEHPQREFRDPDFRGGSGASGSDTSSVRQSGHRHAAVRTRFRAAPSGERRSSRFVRPAAVLPETYGSRRRRGPAQRLPPFSTSLRTLPTVFAWTRPS